MGPLVCACGRGSVADSRICWGDPGHLVQAVPKVTSRLQLNPAGSLGGRGRRRGWRFVSRFVRQVFVCPQAAAAAGRSQPRPHRGLSRTASGRALALRNDPGRPRPGARRGAGVSALAAWRTWLVLSASLGLGAGCSSLRYASQAAVGQFQLAAAARPVPEVLADPTTPARTRELLRAVADVRAFAAARGLHVAGNYEQYVELDRNYPVWFVNASHPLSFSPKVFSFPIIGSFPGLSWFREEDAERFAAGLRARGYDVHKRGVSAFSTGGWLDDPLVWSMFSASPAALGFLVNTIVHESVHATVLIKDQQYYNESLASFVGDNLAREYFEARYGQDAPPWLAYQRRRAFGRQRAKQLNELYQQLDSVYRSALPAPRKRQRKRALIDAAVERLELRARPNNASLIGFRLYQVGGPDFSALLAACGGQWRRFLTAVSEVSPDAFGRKQQPDFEPVLSELTRVGCPQRLFPLERSRRTVWRSKQRRRLRRIWHRR